MTTDGFARRAGLATLLVLHACSSPAPIADAGPPRPPESPLVVAVTCRGGNTCRMEKTELFFDVTITNTSPRAIGFPLAFLQKTGPVIRVFDLKTDRETFLRTNLAPLTSRPRTSSRRSRARGGTSNAWPKRSG